MNHIERERIRTTVSPSDPTQTPRMAEAISYCGKRLTGMDWAFVDYDHAQRSLTGSVPVCQACLRAAKAKVR